MVQYAYGLFLFLYDLMTGNYRIVAEKIGAFIYSVDIFHVLVLQELWVLMESRIRLKPVQGGVKIVALSISSKEQTQLNRVYCFINL